ncbi:MAG TPA: hypothetical protein DD734_09685 [Firmicutes bacterium]|nr:hypothetical protein [Bacillota bacterium]
MLPFNEGLPFFGLPLLFGFKQRLCYLPRRKAVLRGEQLFLIGRMKIFKDGKNKFTTLPKLSTDYRLMFKRRIK